MSLVISFLIALFIQKSMSVKIVMEAKKKVIFFLNTFGNQMKQFTHRIAIL